MTASEAWQGRGEPWNQRDTVHTNGQMGEIKDRREDVTLGRDAFTARIEGLLDPAYRLASMVLLDYAAAGTAVHDATLRAWARYRQAGGDVLGFRTWFLTIVMNECRRVLWARRLTLRSRGEGPEASDLLSDVALQLGTNARVALFCHYFLGLGKDEVARVMGVSPSRLRTRIYRAEQRVRSELEREGEEVLAAAEADEPPTLDHGQHRQPDEERATEPDHEPENEPDRRSKSSSEG
jgi:DNA-directed RNA polymerase specialized sigma24 family protein